MGNKDENLLGSLGGCVGDLLNMGVDTLTTTIVSVGCKMFNVETDFLKEKKIKEELEVMQEKEKRDALISRVEKRKEKEKEKIREDKVNEKNTIYINGEKIDFSDLWFNLGLKNKSKDVPILIDYKIKDLCNIFKFELPVGITKSSIEESKEEIAAFFGVHNSEIEIRKQKDNVDLIVITDDIFEKTYRYNPYNYRNNKGLSVPIGYYLSNEYELKLLEVDLSIKGFHAMLIGGMSGFGKSTLLRLILLHLVINHDPSELQIVLFAGKGDSDFLFLKDTAQHLYKNSIYTDIDDIIGDEQDDKKGIDGYNGVLDDLVEEIKYRNKLFSSLGCKDIDEYYEKGHKELPYKLVIFDEYSYYHTSKKFAKLQSCMGVLSQTARSCGIKVIIALQDSQKEYYSAAIKYNTPLKALFKAENSSHSKNLCNKPGLESIERIGEGRFYSAVNIMPGREYISFKGILPNEDTDELIKLIKNKYK